MKRPWKFLRTRKVKAMIKLSKDSAETNLGVFVDKLFSHPEGKCIKIKELEISGDNKNKTIISAVNKIYHDAYSNINWSLEKIYQFWFVQIQALGKLYRNDFLISSHLANSNINETFVQQMVLRDLKYHTNHHQYGDKEDLIYLKYTGQCPY